MRSRTELVTTTLQDSENEEDQSEVDSEEDWKPEKVQLTFLYLFNAHSNLFHSHFFYCF